MSCVYKKSDIGMLIVHEGGKNCEVCTTGGGLNRLTYMRDYTCCELTVSAYMACSGCHACYYSDMAAAACWQCAFSSHTALD